MKINARLNEEVPDYSPDPGDSNPGPPWDPNNPPYWWNPNTPIPPGFPHQYPQDLNGDGVISVTEWLFWVNAVSEAWREASNEDNPTIRPPRYPDLYGDNPYGVAPWIGRGGLPTHINHNPWWLLPPRGGEWEKSHPLYYLYIEWIENAESNINIVQIIIDALLNANPALPQWLVDYVLELFFGEDGPGLDGEDYILDFESFLRLLRFFWSPHIPSSWGDKPLIGRLLLLVREIMLNGLMGVEQFAELFGLLNAASEGFHSVPFDPDDPSMPGAPDLDGDGEPDLGMWFMSDGRWYWIPDGSLNPDQVNPLDVPEVIDRPEQPEMTPPPDPFQFDPPGAGPITPLAQVEGEFAKAFARYNKGMNGKGIR